MTDHTATHRDLRGSAIAGMVVEIDNGSVWAAGRGWRSTGSWATPGLVRRVPRRPQRPRPAERPPLMSASVTPS